MRYVITYEIYVKSNWRILFIFQKCTFSADLFMSVNLIDDRPLAYRQQSIDRQQYGHGSHYTPTYGVQIEHVQRRACLQQLIRQLFCRQLPVFALPVVVPAGVGGDGVQVVGRLPIVPVLPQSPEETGKGLLGHILGIAVVVYMQAAVPQYRRIIFFHKGFQCLFVAPRILSTSRSSMSTLFLPVGMWFLKSAFCIV